MIANIIGNQKINQIVTEIFMQQKKLNIFNVFITKSYLALPEDVRLNYTHFSP